jgi:hypothetical protein
MSIINKFVQYTPTRSGEQQTGSSIYLQPFERIVDFNEPSPVRFLRVCAPSTLHMNTHDMATWQHKIIDYLFKPTLHMQILIT